MKTIESIKTAITPIAREYGVKRVYLFGSYAKGTANEDSDVDLLIEIGDRISLLGLSEMLQDAKEAMNISVDLVTRGGIDQEFENEIAGSEVLLYER